jgi:UDPglucose 6-dehydrogenase
MNAENIHDHMTSHKFSKPMKSPTMHVGIKGRKHGGMKVSVVGLGYLGVTHAVALANLGHEVVGYDIDQARVKSLSVGQIPFYEPGLDEFLSKAQAAEQITFKSSLGDWCKDIDAHFICVGTPLDQKSDSISISHVLSSISELLPFLGDNPLIVGRSTVPVGTSIEIQKLLSSHPRRVRLAWNPEFLSEGTALNDALSPERIVIGVEDLESEKELRHIYESMLSREVPFQVMDITSAELTKIASNAFLALKISYINGIASIAEKVGASTKLISQAMGLDPRIGSEFLRNGIGFGGSCLPKDLSEAIATANLYGSSQFGLLLSSVRDINQERLETTIELVEREAKFREGVKISVLGASFKSNTDDVRNSPGVSLALSLQQRGFNLTLHDPVAARRIKHEFPLLDSTDDIIQSIHEADVLVFTTNWSDYKTLIPPSLGDLSKSKTAIDAVQAIDAELWREAGWSVVVLGESNQMLPADWVARL